MSQAGDHTLFLSILLAGGSENSYYIWTKLYKSAKKMHTYIIEIDSFKNLYA